ncbi:MAG: TetR family transcriptional regulator [Chthoniobacteraceae bacterium]|nr:TetR family transcriptional regulator [Chthoniobacteraceae bacterium]
MRYDKTHKETTRRRVIEVASARFRKEGIDAVGVASLMGDAGLTHGGFYSHFPSKDALIKEAIAHAMEGSLARHQKTIESGDITTFIRAYLRSSHRDHPESGCVAAALASEVARHPAETRTAFTEEFNRLVDFITKLLPEHDAAIAQAILATLIGTLQLARAVSDPVLSDAILAAGEAGALALVDSKRRD